VPVEPTRSSLLSRLRDPADQAAWREFEDRYRDLIVRFCRSRGLQLADAEDVAQAVLTNLVSAMPRFTYDRQKGRFRDYLFRCVRSVLSRRPDRAPAQLLPDEADRAAPADAQAWEHEWMSHHYRRAVESLRAALDAQSLSVFDRSLAGLTPAQIAAEFGMGVEAVYKARQRVRARVEQTIADQIAEEDRLDA
jgi:RNA polymerase sigma factor (sigma-70 family)